MANTNPSANMMLPIPAVGVDPGPDYATNVNNSLTIIDGHDHSPGYGVQITPAGLNISTDLPMNSNNLTLVRSVRFQPQSSSLTGPLDLGILYESGVDLFYRDGAGNNIPITANGAVAGTPGSIANLVAPASASYNVGSNTFVFQSDVATAGFLDVSSILIRNHTANSKALTLAAPAAMGADYSIVLPPLPTINGSFVTMDTAGTQAAVVHIDNSTLVINSNVLSVSGPNIPNSDREHAWELNGIYSGLTFPLNNIDSVFMVPYDITITSVWIYNGNAGTSGSTEFDLVYGPSAGPFVSIFSATPQVTTGVSSNVWTDTGTVIGAQGGVIKGTLSVTSIPAGNAIFWNLKQSRTGTPSDARIRMFYRQST